ncbi:hypothetical protein, partial [Chamaesiphon sp. VAR_69_metabat_338]|uniref:hypothetical protein n=1 Tax=Chamaesiphon sp. VAR_69_metabat_338 TaxID=2964704 RepID=UPI00286E95BA
GEAVPTAGLRQRQRLQRAFGSRQRGIVLLRISFGFAKKAGCCPAAGSNLEITIDVRFDRIIEY